MSEPLPHYVNIAKKLKDYGIDAHHDPMMHILGGRVVTAEIDAKIAMGRVASLLAAFGDDTADLDSFDVGHLTDTADAIGSYQRARRDLLTTAENLGLRNSVAEGSRL